MYFLKLMLLLYAFVSLFLCFFLFYGNPYLAWWWGRILVIISEVMSVWHCCSIWYINLLEKRKSVSYWFSIWNLDDSFPFCSKKLDKISIRSGKKVWKFFQEKRFCWSIYILCHRCIGIPYIKNFFLFCSVIV